MQKSLTGGSRKRPVVFIPFSLWGCVGDASHMPITLGKLNGIFDKKVKHWEFVVQRYMTKYAQKAASHSGDPHQAAGTLRAHGDTEQTATQKAGPSGLLVQGAMIDKPAEEDTTVQQLRTAEIKQFVAAKKKRNKARACFSW